MGPATFPNSSTLLHFPTLSLAFYHVLFISLILFTYPSTLAADPHTIYDYLRLQGLPPGILPKGVTNFSVNPTTGGFQVFLDHPCDVKLENQFHYDTNITGELSLGRIGCLSGVSSQELFLWFAVKGIHVDLPSSGLIYFDVGVVNKQFSLSVFESPLDCLAVDPVNPSGDGGADGNADESGPQVKWKCIFLKKYNLA